MPERTIPLIKADLPEFEAVEAAFRQILQSGRVTNFGPYLQQFESEAGRFLDTEAVCVSSATAGLVMTLQALEIPPGSRIGIPSFSFVATAQAVLYAGCTPAFIDIAADGNADPADLEHALADVPDMRGLVLVHLYGSPCRTETIAAVVREAEARRGYRIPLVYDAAHAFGSARGTERVGGAGDAEVFSTSVTKVMTSVEGGIVSTRNAALAGRLRKMRNYGIESHYNAHWPGLNGKMSEFHAIIGLRNLARLDTLLQTRQRKALIYADLIERRTAFEVMTTPAGTRSTYKDFTIVVPPSMKGGRDLLMEALSRRGVETRAYFFPPIHEQTYFRQFAGRPLPVTEDLSRRVVTLPFYTTITDDEMLAVVDALAAAETELAGQLEGARA